ncbi:MAG: hypothetical protein PUB52_04160 [Lachnospiraceae bacterium]|nr:hypothetical protein [Lachnospiraceae bacterium]
MRRNWLIVALLMGMVVSFLAGCGSGDDFSVLGPTESDSGQLSYEILTQMEEASVYKDRVVIALEEDQALPYRWEYQLGGEGVTLEQEYLVEEPEEDLPNLAVGSAPAYRVYELSCEQGASAIFTVTSRHVANDEVRKQRIYEIGTKQDTIWVK